MSHRERHSIQKVKSKILILPFFHLRFFSFVPQSYTGIIPKFCILTHVDNVLRCDLLHVTIRGGKRGPHAHLNEKLKSINIC